MYDRIIFVYKNFLDDVKGQFYLDGGCEITFGILRIPAQHTSLIPKKIRNV